MSTELEHYVWPTSFSCTLVIGDIVIPNQYNVTVAIDPLNPIEVATGFRRLRTLVDACFQNSIFICSTNELFGGLKTTKSNLVQYPIEPSDYYVGSVLFRKFQSITLDYFEIGYITIDSILGDHVQYCIRDPEETGLDLSGDHWWNQDNLDTGAGSLMSWEDLDLTSGPKFEPQVIKGGRSEKQ